MAKGKPVVQVVKLQIQAGKATPAPPVGPALGQAGIAIMDFCKQFNSQTAKPEMQGYKIPVEISVHRDRTFSFITKTPPASDLIKKACKKEKGSQTPGKVRVAMMSKEDVRKVAEMKMADLNAIDIEGAMKIIEGTARSMGIEVKQGN